jgi:hypothetical protein
MGKRKLIEFMDQLSHALHSFSTGAFPAEIAEIFPQIGANEWWKAGFHKKQTGVPVENEWKTRADEAKAPLWAEPSAMVHRDY